LLLRYNVFVILEIVKYGHPALREKGVRIKQITPEIRQLAAAMIETMYAADGVGLAAQQVGRPLMLTVIDISSSEHPGEMFVNGHPQDVKTRMPLVLVNPQLSHAEGEQVGPEGCLSIPEVNADIRRAAKIHVRAQTLEGAEIAFDCTGLLGRAAQHEVDHLNGILFTDRMDAATRVSMAGKLKKLQKETLAQLAKTTKPRRRLVRL
jgi:peptide deformylase